MSEPDEAEAMAISGYVDKEAGSPEDRTAGPLVQPLVDKETWLYNRVSTRPEIGEASGRRADESVQVADLLLV